MKAVIVLSGISGAGKSAYIQKLVSLPMLGSIPHRIVSANHFFQPEPGNDASGYHFRKEMLPVAHGLCMRNYIRALEAQTPMVLVDNTNTTVEEIAPYMAVASALGYDAEILTIRPESKRQLQAVKRRSQHNVPHVALHNQALRLQARELPRFWKATEIKPEGLIL